MPEHEQEQDFWGSYQSYLTNPDLFDEDQVSSLAKAAERNGVQFEYANTSASLGSIATNVWDGFIQGFTTLPVGDKPTNDIDGIAHSIGHLMGFIGIIPGLGTGVSMASKVGIKGAGFVGKALSRSVPMRVADIAMKKAKGTGVAKSVLNATDSILGTKAKFGRQALRHGAHLGVASMTSSIWDDMKEEDVPGFLANSFMTGLQGGIFGATFAGIGNIKLPPGLDKAKVGKFTGRDVLKGVAGSLAQATPAALSGASTPENVYNALLGAYFGGKAKPWAYEQAHKRQTGLRKEGKDPASEMEFSFFRESDQFKNLSKAEQEAEIDVHDTLFNAKEAGDVLSRFISQFGGGDAPTPSKERLATVRSANKEHADKQVVVVSHNDTMAKIRVEGSDPVDIRMEDLRFEDEAPMPLVKKEKSDPASDVEAADPSPGDAPIDIPITRPVEKFIRKIHKIGEDKPLDQENYDKNLDDLSRIIYDKIEAAKEKTAESDGVRTPHDQKVYDKHLTIAEETSDPLEKLSALQAIKNRAARDKSDTSDIESIIKPIEEALKSEGYEISDIKGEAYSVGKTVKVINHVEDGTLKQGEVIIGTVIKPQIMKDGKLVQAAEVIVKSGTRKLTAKEFKQEELKLERSWAESEKTLREMGMSKVEIAKHKKAHDDFARLTLEELKGGTSPEAAPKREDLATARKDLLLESQQEIIDITKANKGLELSLGKKKGGKESKGGAEGEFVKKGEDLFSLDRGFAKGDEFRIGNIRTRDPENSVPKGVGTKLFKAIKNEFIAKGKDHIDIETNPGSEGFWEKMGFKFDIETREGYPIEASLYSGTQRPPPKGKYGRYQYTYDLKPELEAFEAVRPTQEKTPWKTVKEDILKRFEKYDVNETDLAEIRNYYRRRTESIEVPRFALHQNKLVPEVEYDFNNNRVSSYEPMKLVNRIAMDNGIVQNPSDAYFVVKNRVEYQDYQHKRIQNSIGNKAFTPEDYSMVVSLARDKGYYPYSGKSDSPVLIFMKKNLGSDPVAEQSRIKSDFKELDPKFEKEYDALKEQARKEGNISSKDYDEMFISNVRWWEAINGGINLKDLAVGDGYIKDVMNFNKRQQPLFSDYYSLTSDTFNKNFRYITTNDLKDSQDPATKKLLKWKPEHDDGAVTVRMDKLDMMVEDMGLPESSGFAKPFFTSNQEQGGQQLGTLIGKLAFHGASKELSLAMKEAGIDFIIPKSVAKQYGKRQLIDYNYTNGKLGFSVKGKSIDPTKSGFVYEMSPADVAVSWGVKDGSSYKMNDPVRVYKQIQEQFMNYDVQSTAGKKVDINRAMNKFIREKFEGEESFNIDLAEYIQSGKRNKKTLEFLSRKFERLGAMEIVDAMKDMSEAGESFRELVRHKIQRLSEEGMEENGMQSETDWEGSFLKEKMTSAQALLENGGTKDAVALSKDLAPLLDRSMTRYFLKRILTPQVNGAKAIMRTYSLDLAQRTNEIGNTSRMIKEKDIFFLDDNFQSKKMNILDNSGRVVYGKTLLDQWEVYRKEPDGTVLKGKMEERMRSVVVRTPIDSISGLADLKFAGFTGIKGGGVLLHPEIMKRLGGADLDIDSAMIYMDSLPKEFHEVGRAFRNDYSNIMKYANKKYATNEKKDNGYDEIIKKYIVEDSIEGRNSLVGMFDPFLRMKTASTIQNAGEVMRGIAVNAKTQIRMLYNVARKAKDKTFTHITNNGDKIEFVAKDSELDLKLHGMAAVTVTVDVAKFGELKSPGALKRILFNSGFKGLYITEKGSRKRNKLTDEEIESYFDPANKGINYKDSPIGEFAETVSKFFGKNWSTGLSWNRSDVITAAENHPKWDNSIYSTLSNYIKQLDYSDSMFERMQFNSNRLNEFGRTMTQVVRDNPEITRYVKGDYRVTPLYEISKRMQLLSANYTTSRVNKFAYEKKYNLATSDGIKAMANNIDVFNAFINKHTLKDYKGNEYNFLTTNKSRKGRVPSKDFKTDILSKSSLARELYLIKYIKQVNDYMSNDLRDLASLKTINDTGSLHNIKPDAELPRYNPKGGEDQLASLNKFMMDMATNIKAEFKRIYKEAGSDKENSPNATALDSISKMLNGDQPTSVKSMLIKGAEDLNAHKRESDQDVTYQGLREYFDSLLLGSINRGNKTESLYFVPQLVSKNVLNRFNQNMVDIFKNREKKPTYSEIENLFTRDETHQIIEESAKLNKEVHDIEFLNPKIPIKDLSSDVRGYYDRIEKQLVSFQESANMSPENMKKFITSFFSIQSGKVDFRAVDKFDLAGFEAFLKDLNHGGGVFSWFTRGKGSKYAKFWAEVDKKGYIKNARGFWIKMAETVAFEHMKNDVTLIDRNVKGWKWVKVPDPDNPGKFKQIKEHGIYKSWVPTSHFQKIIDANHGMDEYVSGVRNIINERLDEILGNRVVRGASSGKNKFDDLVDIAWREVEAGSAINKSKKGLTIIREETNNDQSADSKKFKKRLKDGFDTYNDLLKDKYNYTIKDRTGNYSAREIIDVLKVNMRKAMRETFVKNVKISANFQDMLEKVIVDTKSKKSIKISQGEIGVTEIPITTLVEKIITPLIQPGYVVDRAGKHLTLEDSQILGVETNLKIHSEDSWDRKTKLSNVEEYNADYSRTTKDVYRFEQIENLFMNKDGKRISLFDFFKNPEGTFFNHDYAQRYLNNLLVMLKPDKLDIGWQKKHEADWDIAKNNPRGISKDYFLFNESYKAYKKFIKENPDFSSDEVLQQLGRVRGYFTKNNKIDSKGYVAWKEAFIDNNQPGESYSQFKHDIALSERKIDMPLYIRQKRRHDPYTGFQPVGDRGRIYLPHGNYDEPTLNKETIEHLDKISKTSNSEAEFQKAKDEAIDRKNRLVQNSKKEDRGLADKARDSLLLRDLGGDKGIKHLYALGSGSTPGSMLKRSHNFDGYSRHFSELGKYAESIQAAIGTEISSILSKTHIRNFSKKKPMGEHTKDWEDYMRIFARDVMGAPSTLSKEMLDSKSLNIKSTPWWYTSDEYLYSKKSVYKLVDKLSGRSKPSAFVKELYNKRYKGLDTNGQMELFTPKSVEREGFDDWWKKQRELFGVRYDKDGMPIKENMNFFSGKMREYSQVEGKYQLATLLARMKVVVNNVFGGGTTSWVYNGAAPMRAARKIEEWQSIDPRFRTMKDVDDWVYELGVVPEMLKFDLGYVGARKDPNWEAFSREVATLAVEKARSSGDTNIYDVRFRDLVKKHSIGSKAMEFASSFMGKSELFLRVNTFKAGYLSIRESMSPVSYELNDPYLIQQAKKAVKASQFLYSAPFRPAFARTSAGKIYSRFKLWAWNSVKFRKDVYKDIKYAGFRPGSPQAKRIERMAIADLFMIGMAKLLPYTMFDYSLPAPYSYFQDTADWMFGSDQQRERAFYGALPRAIAPLHEFMPSFLRGPEAAFGNIFTGNWERFADYTLVSHFPFGMLTRDLLGAIQSPAMIGEFVTGIPLHRLGRLKDDVVKGKKPSGYAPGF